MTTTLVVPDKKQQVLDFPMERVVKRYCLEENVSGEDAVLHERELKRYLYICANYRDDRWPMVRSIDGLWHTFLLFTRSYQEFCQVAGVPFIHHEPMDEKDKKGDLAGLQVTYERFMAAYQAEFGEPARFVWPERIDSNCHDCGGACGGGDCESNCVQCR